LGKENRTGHLQEVRHHRRVIAARVLMAGKTPCRRGRVKGSVSQAGVVREQK